MRDAHYDQTLAAKLIVGRGGAPRALECTPLEPNFCLVGGVAEVANVGRWRFFGWRELGARMV